MNKKYPIVNKDFYLHVTAKDCTLFHIVKSDEFKNKYLGLKIFSKWLISPLMANYLMQCDGSKTHEEIVSNLNVPFSLLVDNGAMYLKKETNVIAFKDEKEECKNNLFITGSFSSYNPIHISIEITDYCNFRCKHCYVSSCPEKLAKRSYEDMINLMDKLWNNGVKVIELTGGECTTHPKFREILRYASDKFNLVSIISNGYLIGKDESLAEFIGNLNNVTVQISIDGNKEFHDKFRGKKGAFDNAVNAVKNLRKENVLVRIASSITWENVEQLEFLFKLSKELDANALAVSPVSTFGRGSCYKSCSNADKNLKDKINSLLEKYKDDTLFKANKESLENMIKNKEINCGAGWRTFAINGSSGEVRICLLTTDIGVIGNIDKDEYSSIFSKDKLDAYRMAPSPNQFLETCKDCEYKDICNGCIVKALSVYKNHYPQCPWAKKYNIKL